MGDFYQTVKRYVLSAANSAEIFAHLESLSYIDLEDTCQALAQELMTSKKYAKAATILSWASLHYGPQDAIALNEDEWRKMLDARESSHDPMLALKDASLGVRAYEALGEAFGYDDIYDLLIAVGRGPRAMICIQKFGPAGLNDLIRVLVAQGYVSADELRSIGYYGKDTIT